jgi:DNA invertase Pin-like site-specific DNA recombinase
MPRKTPAEAASGPDRVPTYISYLRVSTDQQGRSGLGIEAQRAVVAAHVSQAGGLLIHELEETESGKKSDRPQLAAALAACRTYRATLIVAKLDRLTRDTAFLLTLVDGQGEAGVVFCDLPMLPPGPIGKFFLTVMAAIAELERGFISMRTKAAMAALKARGVKLGNPNLRSAGAGPARKRAARSKAREVAPYLRRAEKAGAETLAQKADALTALGIKTPAGLAEWSPEQVRRIEFHMKRQETGSTGSRG